MLKPYPDNSPPCNYWSWWVILPVHIGLVGSNPSGELVLVIVVIVGNNVGFILSGGELSYSTGHK